LYEEVSEFGLVITTDAALATALNARLDKAIVGHFAVTPKKIASYLASRVTGKPLLSELDVIAAISAETHLSLKHVHSEVENIKEIRKYTKDVESNLHGRRAKTIYESYEPLPTLEKLMGEFIPEDHDNELYTDKPVAVIAVDLFNDLDKHFIPLEYTPISIFKDEEYDIDTIYEIGNDRQLADNAIDIIDPDKPFDYAIVLNTASPIADAVRAALYRKNLPFINALNVRDLSQIRDYLQFISLALDFETIRVRNVKELFSNYKGFFTEGQDEYLLSKQNKENLKGSAEILWETMRDIYALTYGEVCERICDSNTGVQVSMMLKALNVQNTKIGTKSLNDIKYAVDNVNELKHSEQIPDEEKKGVLIADCNNSVYIDRPVVIYLGMEQDWNRSVVGKRYLDVEAETDKNVTRLNALIQQGSSRYYFVNSTKGGNPARPSLLFDLIYGRPVERFSDMCTNLVRGRWHHDPIQSIPDDSEKIERSSECYAKDFSKSSFNNYYLCPRRFLFGIGLKTPEEKTTEFGNLIHAFAEYYVCYPEDVKELGVEHFLSLIGERYSGLSSPMMKGVDTDKIRKAMTSTIEFIDSLQLGDVPLDVLVSSKKRPNRFMIAMGKEMTSSRCEMKLVPPIKHYPVYGEADLCSNGIITDYKTGKPHSASTIAKDMDKDTKSKHPEFQPMIYLSLLHEMEGAGDEFKLFYVMDNDIESSEGEIDIQRNTRTVRLSKSDIKNLVTTSTDLAEELSRDNRTAINKKFRDHIESIMQVIAEMGSDVPDEWADDFGLITNILDVCGKNDNKTNRGDAEAAVRKIASHAKGGVLTTGNTVTIPWKIYEETMSMISDKHREMQEQSKTKFEVNKKAKCSDCQFFSVCMEDNITVDEGVDDDE